MLAGGLAVLGRGIVLWSAGRYAEASGALEEGLEVARDLGNRWWIAYALTYLGALRASLGDCAGGLRLSREAIEAVRGPQIGYPLYLAQTQALWQQEVLVPGALEHRLEIEEALTTTERLGLNGLALNLTWVRLLHRVADVSICDAAVKEELARVVRQLRTHRPVKGAVEVLGLQVVRALEQHRPSIARGELQQVIRTICAKKARSLKTGQEQFLDTRRPWEPRG
jgi:hypothetical protein